MWAIIGGTGFEKFEGFKTLEELDPQTPFGKTSIGFKKVDLEGEEILFIPRHGTDHDKLPSEVNYRANIFALKKYGATKLLGFSAVGSLQEELKPGDLVVPDQFIDRTKNLRKVSFGGEGIVNHVSLASPVTGSLVQALQELSPQFNFNSHFHKTLVVMEGPNFSTKAESHLYRQWGADIVGMTSYPEFALAREAGLAYMNCCFVTDYDCWNEAIAHVTIDEVAKTMAENNKKAFVVARAMVHCNQDKVTAATEHENGLKNAIMTPMHKIPAQKKKWLDVLLS